MDLKIKVLDAVAISRQWMMRRQYSTVYGTADDNLFPAAALLLLPLLMAKGILFGGFFSQGFITSCISIIDQQNRPRSSRSSSSSAFFSSTAAAAAAGTKLAAAAGGNVERDGGDIE